MQTVDIVKAWKSEEHQDALTLEQRASLPARPSGVAAFEDSEIEAYFEACPVACMCQISWAVKCCCKGTM